MGPSIKSIQDVTEKQLCCGCGACAYIHPEAIQMVDVIDQGRRPVVSSAGEGSVPRRPIRAAFRGKTS